MTYEQMQILNQLVSKFKDKQINICIEEMSELTKALCKHKRGQTDMENIKEEIADVHIMLMQMLILFEIDTDEFLKTVDFKIKRTEERLLISKKKIKDLTLEELENFCNKQEDCQHCPFVKHLCRDGRLSEVLARCFYKTGVENEVIWK